VGGPRGYEDFLDIIRDPAHEEHRSTLRWAGGHFHLEWFDLDLINKDLRNALRANPRRRLHQPKPKAPKGWQCLPLRPIVSLCEAGPSLNPCPDRPMTEIAPQPRIKLSKLRDIGWSLWDPIGLLDPRRPGRWDDEANLSFADEYDSYLIAAASQLRRGTPRDEVVAFLVEIETRHMGMADSPSARPRAEAVVDAILADDSIWTWPDAQGRFGEG